MAQRLAAEVSWGDDREWYGLKVLGEARTSIGPLAPYDRVTATVALQLEPDGDDHGWRLALRPAIAGRVISQVIVLQPGGANWPTKAAAQDIAERIARDSGWRGQVAGETSRALDAAASSAGSRP